MLGPHLYEKWLKRLLFHYVDGRELLDGVADQDHGRVKELYCIDELVVLREVRYGYHLRFGAQAAHEGKWVAVRTMVTLAMMLQSQRLNGYGRSMKH
jgi:hypothetical protein